MKLVARADLDAPPLAEFGRLDEAAFRARFAGGPVRRVGRARFLRNVMIAIGNSGQAGLAAVATERLRDPSPIVRGAAIWALAQLLSREELASVKGRADSEEDATTLNEWRSALGAPDMS